ncbi:Inositol phosphatase SIW14 [Knufia obscura]|uniref:ER membrane protein complex subunit 2 n=2 Tax=Knufia TaxID=430999 RepID=A0AAN8EDE3_9EURO|nr:Inositol phosphatase SIW14 [Knufia obscura]KAK5951550.1 Inositol phosphatase SIW14 [Knufia fluminis]
MSTQIQYYNHDDPATAMSLSQRASTLLSKSSLKNKSQLLSIVSAIEEPSEWAELEQVFLACLRTGDDESAHLCLERLTARFGAENHRIMALRGLYQEAEAKTEEDLRRILQGYNQIVKEDPMNIPIHKRRTALIRSVGMPADALECLVQFLASFPSDTEAWCELSDLYQKQGLNQQAIFSMEEALLLAPNAWNLHARLGELNYLSSQSAQEGAAANEKYLTEAVRRFARSVELCQDYLRGYYGLKLATDKLSSMAPTKGAEAMAPETVQQLNATAVTKLKHIIKQDSSPVSGPRKAELIAAQALLDQSKS